MSRNPASRLLLGALALTGLAGQARAQSAALAQNLPVAGEMLVAEVEAAGGGPALILADGYLSPEGAPRVGLFLTVDGTQTGNEAVLDWRGTHHPVTHGFRLLAAPSLPPGPHRIKLIARTDGRVTIGAGALLSVLSRPAPSVTVAHPASAGLGVQTNTPPLTDADRLPHVLVAEGTAPADGKVVALASGSIAYAGDGKTGFGDSFWGLWHDGAEATGNAGTYADNDVCRCAELAAPLSVQGLFAGGGRVAVAASAEPWAAKLGADPAHYTVAADTTLVLLQGMEVAGGLAALSAAPGERVIRFPYLCIASSHAYPGCPATGSPKAVAEADFDMPAKSARPVLFSAALRLQGDGHDGGGRFEAWIVLDGKTVGSRAVQDLSPASAVSTRTLTLSYLAYGAQALQPGRHHIALMTRAQGEFEHLAVTRNLPLIWFD